MVVQDGGTPPRSATGMAHITVLDENDNAPTFTHTRPDRDLLLQVKMSDWTLSYIAVFFVFLCWMKTSTVYEQRHFLL